MTGPQIRTRSCSYKEMKAEAINPEVIQAAKEGAEYRRKTQAILGRGW